MVNNAGLSQRDEFVNCDFGIAGRLMDVNCLSPIALIKGFLPKFIKQGEGQIVNVLSVAAVIGTPVRSLYSASKFALDGFGKALQAEVSDHNISVLQCYPAYVRTNISKNALVGEGVAFGKTDSNIANGQTVEEACQDLIKAIYLKRFWITLGSPYFVLAPRLLGASEFLTKRLTYNNF